jgi:hypothetical protein
MWRQSKDPAEGNTPSDSGRSGRDRGTVHRQIDCAPRADDRDTDQRGTGRGRGVPGPEFWTRRGGGRQP